LEGGIKGLGWPLESVKIRGTSRMLFLGSGLEPVLWDFTTQEEVFRLTRYKAFQIAVHPDGSRFLTVDSNTLTVHAMDDGAPLITLQGCTSPATWSADGRDIICGALDGNMQIIHSDDWKERNADRIHRDRLEEVQELVGLRE
jgi:hypothetical protein